jgi:hypothetical protein
MIRTIVTTLPVKVHQFVLGAASLTTVFGMGFFLSFLHVDLIMKCEMSFTGECLITNTARVKGFLLR